MLTIENMWKDKVEKSHWHVCCCYYYCYCVTVLLCYCVTVFTQCRKVTHTGAAVTVFTYRSNPPYNSLSLSGSIFAFFGSLPSFFVTLWHFWNCPLVSNSSLELKAGFSFLVVTKIANVPQCHFYCWDKLTFFSSSEDWLSRERIVCRSVNFFPTSAEYWARTTFANSLLCQLIISNIFSWELDVC